MSGEQRRDRVWLNARGSGAGQDRQRKKEEEEEEERIRQMRNVTAGSEVERKSSVGEVRVSSDHKRSGRRVDAPAARTCETGQDASP
jgi:phage-related minor tail protein